jgi:hypothetical protein
MDGYIRLRGKLITGLAKEAPDPHTPWDFVRGEVRSNLVFDTIEDEAGASMQQVYGFKIFQHTDMDSEDGGFAVALALRGSGMPNTFRRVGLILALPPDCFDAASEVELIIV